MRSESPQTAPRPLGVLVAARHGARLCAVVQDGASGEVALHRAASVEELSLALAHRAIDVALLDPQVAGVRELLLSGALAVVHPAVAVIAVVGGADAALEEAVLDAGAAHVVDPAELEPRHVQRAIRIARRRGADAEDRRRADRHARAVRQRQQLMLSSLPDTAVILYDRALRVVDADGVTAVAANDHTDASVRGAHVREFFSPEEYAPLAPVLEAALRGETGSVDGRAGTADFRVDAAPFLEDGVLTGVLTVWRDTTRARAAERERRDADRHLGVAFESAPIGMAMIDLDGRVLRANPAMCGIMGYTAQELIEQPPLHGIHPDDLDLVRQGLGGLSTADSVLRIPHRVVRAGGTTAWVDSRVTLMTDDRGTPAYVLAQVVDITEQHIAAQRLTEQHAFTATVLDTAASLVVVLDRHGVITRFNRACQRVSGLSAEAVLGRPLWELEILAPQDLPGFRALFAQRLNAADLPKANTNEWHTADGRRHLIEWSNTALLGEDGEVEFIIATGNDVTEQRAAQAALQASEQRFQGAFEQAPIGMALIDRHGRFEQVNQALCEMTGYDRESLRHLTFPQITHPDDVAAGQRARRAVTAGELDELRTERRYVRADGHVIWGAVSASVMRDAHGGVTHVLVQVMDITERKRVEQQLQHMADHDPLTGLANRRRFEAALGAHIGACAQSGPRGALIVLDIDHFKRVNDTRGHSAGDELIVSVGSLLRRVLRSTDVVARLGGDEFAILLPRVDDHEAIVIAEKLVGAVRELPGVGAGPGQDEVTISLGVLMFADLPTFSSQAAIAHADRAMYAAKQDGRDGYRVVPRARLRSVA